MLQDPRADLQKGCEGSPSARGLDPWTSKTSLGDKWAKFHTLTKLAAQVLFNEWGPKDVFLTPKKVGRCCVPLWPDGLAALLGAREWP